jgi:hypothetical protein
MKILNSGAATLCLLDVPPDVTGFRSDPCPSQPSIVDLCAQEDCRTARPRQEVSPRLQGVQAQPRVFFSFSSPTSLSRCSLSTSLVSRVKQVSLDHEALNLLFEKYGQAAPGRDAPLANSGYGGDQPNRDGAVNRWGGLQRDSENGGCGSPNWSARLAPDRFPRPRRIAKPAVSRQFAHLL